MEAAAAALEAAAGAVERLQALSCPPVAPLVPLEPVEALRLLCTPSARRRALLEWLCCRVHPGFTARLDALQNGPKDARLQEVAKLGAKLMLCRADDMALVEGTAPPQQQLQFIGDLLDAAPPPGDESGGCLEHRCRSTARFLREVLSTPEGAAALDPPPPPPLPSLDAHRSPEPRTPPGPELAAALAAARRHLERLEAQSPELGGAGGPAPPVLPALGVAARDLAALAAAFGASELRDPRGRGGLGAPPAPCGPLAPPVCRRLRHLLQALGAVSQLGRTAAEVTRLSGGAPRRDLESRLTALQQRFGVPPK